MEYSAPIVGAHFRPPAKALLQALGLNQKLWLRHDPENEYSNEALAVHLRTEDISPAIHAEIELHCSGAGYDLAQIMEQSEWQLGYIAESSNKKQGHLAVDFREAVGVPSGSLPGKLGFDMTGAPSFVIDSDAIIQADDNEQTTETSDEEE
jgi:hypothetical protein